MLKSLLCAFENPCSAITNACKSHGHALGTLVSFKNHYFVPIIYVVRDSMCDLRGRVKHLFITLQTDGLVEK